jgi:adenylylsulfate kinase
MMSVVERRQAGFAAGGSALREPGYVIWLTGLPSSGKSTLAELLTAALRRRAQAVEVLDGDEVRRWLTRGLGFGKEERDENVRRVAHVARLLVRHGVAVVVAMISPYRGVRDEARALIGRFLEVHVDCSREECIRRDVKGLYQKALAGGIANFTGVSDPYEPPTAPEVVVRTDQECPDESLARILGALEARGYLEAAGREDA